VTTDLDMPHKAVREKKKKEEKKSSIEGMKMNAYPDYSVAVADISNRCKCAHGGREDMD
jgi:hypothetical protein